MRAKEDGTVDVRDCRDMTVWDIVIAVGWFVLLWGSHTLIRRRWPERTKRSEEFAATHPALNAIAFTVFVAIGAMVIALFMEVGWLWALVIGGMSGVVTFLLFFAMAKAYAWRRARGG